MSLILFFDVVLRVSKCNCGYKMLLFPEVTRGLTNIQLNN